MKQSAGKDRRTWFWVGVGLLSLSALFWSLLIPAIVKNPNLGAIILFILLTALPIGIGIYGIRRGRRRPVVGDVGNQILAEEDTEALVQQQERSNAAHAAERFNRLCWPIVISLCIIAAGLFVVLDLPSWPLILVFTIACVAWGFWRQTLRSRRRKRERDWFWTTGDSYGDGSGGDGGDGNGGGDGGD